MPTPVHGSRRRLRPPLGLLLSALAAAPGCGGSALAPPPPGRDVVTLDGVEYRARTAVLESFPVQLRTEVTLRNRGEERAELYFPDGCVVLIRAYDAGTGSLRWDQGRIVACTMALVPVALEPGDSAAFATGTDAREILGDSLPDGLYRITALVRPNGTPVELAAGEVELAVPR